MSESLVEDVVVEAEEESKPVKKTTAKKTTAKKPAAKKTTRKPRATKKVAESNPEIENVAIQEAETVNEDGQKVITGPPKPRRSRNTRSNLHSMESGSIGSHAANRALDNVGPQQEEKQEVKEEKVALWSNRNIRWTALGTLTKGYNIVKKEAAEKWLDRQGVREATPEEIATFYSK
jgi:hypothetical protein